MAEVAHPALATIRLEIDEARHIAAVTLNRPEAMNAISRQLASDLASVCARLASSSDIRVAILKGAGDRAFCAGADLKERRLLSAEDRTRHTREIELAVESLAALPMPTIACIRGFALAGGAEIAVACDMRVAATSSLLGFPEVRIGIFPGAGGVLRLPRLVGGGAARDLLFSGRRIGAEEAFRIGLVDRLAVPDSVEDEAMSVALEIAANAPLAVRAVKRALAESVGLPHEGARHQVNLLRAGLDASEDYEEGLNAFAERRSPLFSGR